MRFILPLDNFAEIYELDVDDFIGMTDQMIAIRYGWAHELTWICRKEIKFDTVICE